MKLMVASWNNGGGDWNAEAEETALRSYVIDHSLNAPCKCTITLGDPTGAILRKYNADANDVYLGAAKVTLEDPTTTDLFYGRIKRVVGNQAERTVVLECVDWLDQLDEEKITYDMREKLRGNIRQSTGHADADNSRDCYIDAAVTALYAAHADDGGAFTDESEEANDLTAGDMTLYPAVPADDDAYYFGFESVVTSMVLYISTQGDWAADLDWEYWDGDSWENLGKISPTHAKWEFASAVGLTGYSWTDPGDWAKSTENGIEAYYIRAVVDNYVGITTPARASYGYGYEYFFYDDAMAWGADDYNGMNLVFTAGMAGTNTWTFHPYHGTDDGGATVYNDNVENVWTDANTVDGGTHNNDWYIIYKFKAHIGNDTPSDLYVDDSISKATIGARYNVTGAGNSGHIQIYDNNPAVDTYVDIHYMQEDDIFRKHTLDIPLEIVPYVVDDDGFIHVKFDMTHAAGNCVINIYYLDVKLETVTTGLSTAYAISDTLATNRIQVDTDLTATATRVWEGIPYCIAKKIYEHLDTAESVSLSLISDEGGDKSGTGPDPLIELTAAATIEHTAGISTRQYKNRTRLSILKDLAAQDMASFWVELGTSTVTYKKTFGADVAQITDATVESWQSVFDYTTIVNDVKVYGAQIGDYEIYQNSQDAASIAKYKATRTQVIKNAGLVSDTDALTLGTTIAARDSDIEQMIGCSITGNTAHAAHATTLKLGDIVEITSSYLWSTASKDYIVTRWVYDSTAHQTQIALHPKVSIGLQNIRTMDSKEKTVDANIQTTGEDKVITDPITHEVV